MATVQFKGRTVFCKDLKAVTAFYTDLLGFRSEWGDDDHVGLRAPVAGAAGAEVTFLLHVGEPARDSLGWFELADAAAVDEVVATVADAGHTVTQEPADAPWGVREAVIADPEGNTVYLSGALPD